ncbi:MAG: hypothetical protein CMK09_02245 [Ponticaulis sp.]|nr:hypothetical protein [Ponticaulis sp.]
MIGLNLAKLYAWLVRFEASGETHVPSDIADMVLSSDWLVHAFVRMLTSEQLERAGFTFAALAMRDPNINRNSGRQEQAALSPLYANHRFARANQTAKGAAGPTSVGAPASTTKDPAELLARLETTMDNFERAEAIANALARVIVCALVYIFLETPGTQAFAGPANRLFRVGVRPPSLEPMGRDPPYPWPPPTHNVIPFAMRHAMTLCRHGTQNIMFFPLAGSRISSASFHAALRPG